MWHEACYMYLQHTKNDFSSFFPFLKKAALKKAAFLSYKALAKK